ncbi:YusG family protein [Streptomyces cavernae]|uniref:YusG family protein n=1 Tax=Streptomyces cavernae TaxID=2259034 RepID=UPI001EE3AD0C|nr:YusG family protein [Streptomyces cavernae]
MTDPVTGAPTPEMTAPPPADYGLVLPDDWFRIPLEPGQWKRPVRALADKAFEGQDDAVVLKRSLIKDISDRAEAAYENGGIELYISTATIGPIPLSASLLVTVMPPHEDARLTVSGKRRAQEVTQVHLPAAGPAMRRRTRTVPDEDEASGNRLPVTTVDYLVAVPMTAASLLLTFSTPLDAFADAMVELFDAIAGSLHWKRG